MSRNLKVKRSRWSMEVKHKHDHARSKVRWYYRRRHSAMIALLAGVISRHEYVEVVKECDGFSMTYLNYIEYLKRIHGVADWMNSIQVERYIGK